LKPAARVIQTSTLLGYGELVACSMIELALAHVPIVALRLLP
jgi:hypothetical protein